MEQDADLNPRAIARAQTLAFELAEFSGRAGHDLLGPLNQASTLLTLFIKRYESHPDAQAQLLLGFLQSSASMMRGVVASVQTYLDIAASAPGFTDVDMNTAIDSSRLRLAGAIHESSALILADTLPRVSADDEQMASVLEILIGNAIKFRRAEPPRIRISAMQAGSHWLFRIEDNGVGISEEHRESVFLAFRRLNGKEYPGAGMGLTIAKLIVGTHGGKIWIEPAGEPEGTAVLFTVPVSAVLD